MKQKKSTQYLEELERIVENETDSLFRFAFFRIGNLPDAEDIVQDTLLRFYDGKNDLSHIGQLRGYLYRSIANACCDRQRRSATDPVQREAPIPEEADESTPAEWEEEYERIERLLRWIPREQAEIIRMKTADEMTFVEIADILELPYSTVKSRFQYGIEKIRTEIIKEKGTLL